MADNASRPLLGVDPDEYLLLVPGPTPLPYGVLQAMTRPMINHQGPGFAEIRRGIEDGLRKVLQTAAADILIFPSSGTGILESAVANLLSPGDRVLSVIAGSFGERFAAIARAFHAEVDVLEVPWGRAPEPRAVAERLAAGSYAAVFVTHCETSTGALADLEAIGRLKGSGGPLLVVDAVSSLGGAELRMDDWGCDVVLSASQKAMMCPPGLGIAAVAPRAMEVARRATNPRLYWDWDAYLKRAAGGAMVYTPAVPLWYALETALGYILDPQPGVPAGPSGVWRMHRVLRDAVRSALSAGGFDLVVPEAEASPTVTAARLPAGVEAKALMDGLKQRRVEVAGGLGPLHGNSIRVAHMGAVRAPEVLRFAAALDETLKALGRAGAPAAEPAARASLSAAGVL